MFSDVVVSAQKLAKCYHMYEKPHHRLLQILSGERKQYYREFWALKDISFTIKQGEAVGIVGLNGSGKSTLLQLLCRTLYPTKGAVEIHGRVAALLELGSGFNIELTGRENVFLYAALFGLSQKEIQLRYDAIELFADIGRFIDQPVKTYSSGMHVRLAFAVIANIDADVLVIDEALSVGDAFFQQKCMRFLRDFKEKGTLIFVSHDCNAVINLCDRALWLNQGQLLMDASARDVADAYLANLFEKQQGESDDRFIKKIDFIEATEHSGSLEHLPSFGTGDAIIQKVILFDSNQNILTQVRGGEDVTLIVTVKIKNNIKQPIIGFHVKDRLGQIIFGNNTFLTYENRRIEFKSDEVAIAKFSFIMPILMHGNYSIQIGVANGTQENHVLLHWIYDAMIFNVEPVDPTKIFLEGVFYNSIKQIELLKLKKNADTKFSQLELE